MTPGLASVAAPVLDHNGHPVAGLAVTFAATPAIPTRPSPRRYAVRLRR